MAAQRGLVATFMGKPFNDQGGSGTHLHLSLNREGRNAFDAPRRGPGWRRELHLRRRRAGARARADGVPEPHDQRVPAPAADSLAPTRAGWGWDNRNAFIRIPPERGTDAGRDPRGRRRRQPIPGDRRRAGGRRGGIRERDTGDDRRAAAAGPSGPSAAEDARAALDALEADVVIAGALGPPIVDTFLAVKRFEVERHRAWVSDWEIDEYLHHL